MAFLDGLDEHVGCSQRLPVPLYAFGWGKPELVLDERHVDTVGLSRIPRWMAAGGVCCYALHECLAWQSRSRDNKRHVAGDFSAGSVFWRQSLAL